MTPNPDPGTRPPGPGGSVAEAADTAPARPGHDGPGGGRLRSWWPRVRASARTTPVRVWALSLVCVLAVASLFGSAASTLNQARDGLAVLGEGAGQQALNTTDLYLNLAAMDASVADILVMGTDHDLGSGREAALERYESSREEANEVLLDVASLTSEDPTAQANVQALLNGMGTYEQAVGRALLTNDEAQAPPGETDAGALDAYRSATLLMHTELLPKAFNLGLESSAIVRESHEDGRKAVTAGRLWVGAAGVATVGSLLALQLYLRVRFRRRFNVPLLAATAGAVVLTAGVVLSLSSGESHEVAAKNEGMDPAMALFRAEAIATDMQADQSRYLIDDERRDTYQQVYLERAQQVLFRDVRTLPDYYAAVGEVPGSYPRLPGADVPDKDDPGTLGYLGESAQDALLRDGDGEVVPQAEEALGQVLATYVEVQDADERMREAVAAGDTEAAIEIRMEVAADTGGGLFRRHTDALGELARMHTERYEASIDRGQRSLSPWVWGLPVGSLALFALVVVGVRPRLAEYR
ncbi:hypothetical protein [Nocardiopsis sp. NPDC006938]|uniref:hypothetical protein n=1 Tax=Nocardiopsis sp. NPDC006938 TaxID=3364337 RepID=UPI0036CCDB28